MSFTVTSPAASRDLLTIEDIRQAIPGASAEDDETVEAIGLAVADLVSRACRVPGDGIRVPTLLSETIVQTFRLKSEQRALYLARRFVSSVASVVVDGVTLAADDYEVEASTGILTRLEDDDPVCWGCGKVVVTFEAGFEDVPGDLRLAAQAALREQWSAFHRDPLLRSESIDGIGTFTYWVNTGAGGTGGAPVSDMVLGMLAPYRYMPL